MRPVACALVFDKAKELLSQHPLKGFVWDSMIVEGEITERWLCEAITSRSRKRLTTGDEVKGSCRRDASR